MEAVAAVGLVSSILTFIDFSHKLLAGTLETIDAGTTTENRHTTVIADDLKRVTEALETNGLGSSEHEVALTKLARECKKLSEKLLAKLGKLTATSASKRSAFIVAFCSIFRKSDTDKLKTQLDGYRSEILVRLSMIIKYVAMCIQTLVQITSLGGQVHENNTKLVAQFKGVRDNLSNSVGNRLGNLTSEVQSKINALQISLDTLLGSSLPPTPEIRVLRQLYFSSMFSREDSIREPDSGTFKWILDKDYRFEDYADQDWFVESSGVEKFSSDRWEFEKQIRESRSSQVQARDALLSWLSTENGIFHISGKPGSGKSTLMKFIAGHSRTETELKKWAERKQLVYVQFFAWKSGDEMQQSIYGLYRSILFTVLSKYPELIQLIFPEAIEEFLRLPYEAHIDEPYFRPPRLHSGLQKLAQSCSTKDMSLCLLIDGLDEFKNDIAQNQTHKALVKELCSWAQIGNVKLLVSSRPEPAFTEIVPRKLQIHLHGLTKYDIMIMAKGIFDKPDIFKLIGYNCIKLICRIANEASGVFIWVLLVITALRNMAAAGEDTGALHKFLDRGLSLDGLYKELFDSIDPAHRDRINKMLFIVLRSEGECPSCAMMWVDEILDNKCLTPRTSPLATTSAEGSNAELDRKCRLADFWLAETKGLLELTPAGTSWTSQGSRVGFFHRTAYEFFKESQRMQGMSAEFPFVIRNLILAKTHLANIWAFNSSANLGDFRKLLQESWGTEDVSIEQKYHIFDCLEATTSDLIQRPFLACLGRNAGYLNPRRFASNRFTELAWWEANVDCHGASYSHIHHIAYAIDDFEYLHRRLENAPDAMHAHGSLSLLVSAFSRASAARPHTQGQGYPRARFKSPQIPLINYLLEKGVSLNEQVQLPGSGKTASTWMIFCFFFAAHLLWGAVPTVRFNSLYTVLELFLKTGTVDPNVFVVFAPGPLTANDAYDHESGCSYFISLEDLVQGSRAAKYSHGQNNHAIPDELFRKACQKDHSIQTMPGSLTGKDLRTSVLDGSMTSGPMDSTLLCVEDQESDYYVPDFDEMNIQKEAGWYEVYAVVLGGTILRESDYTIRLY
ncbi:hypothetical protein TWF281_004862 [Arthrobotrys megalospora]